jgi:hypothetical protein
MTGHLVLPTGPGATNAVRKDYVDAADAVLSTANALKVDKIGDTMTGPLIVSMIDPVIYLLATGTSSPQIISAKGTTGNPFWQVVLGNSSGHLLVSRYTSGSVIDTPLAIAYDTGRVAFAKGAQFSTDTSFFIQESGTERHFQFMTGWRFLFEEANGTLNWYGDAGGTLKYKSWYNGDFQIGGANAAKVGAGSWTDSSDARIKTVLGPYEHGLAELKQVDPVRYSYKGNSVAGRGAVALDPKARADHADFTNKEFIGVVAQDIEGPLPETVTKVYGLIDGQSVDDLRLLDPSAITWALINAVKELAARVEALEAAQMP